VTVRVRLGPAEVSFWCCSRTFWLPFP